jgi:hypothetical protein
MDQGIGVNVGYQQRTAGELGRQRVGNHGALGQIARRSFAAWDTAGG